MADMQYRRCGKSGVLLPEISLGLWHNFGGGADTETCRAMIAKAMELGICHFDLADNYGPPPGSAEECFGRLLKNDFAARRDEMFISTKAGHLMWPGPYGDWGSRKHLLAGLDQSLRRLQLDYVDVFYSHRPDPNTPLEETIGALVHAVRSGKALYAGLSKYPPSQFNRACEMLREEKVPCLLHQFRYNLLDRACEKAQLPDVEEQQTGSIVFSPLAQGMLTGKYLNGMPTVSRAADESSVFLDANKVEADAVRVAEYQKIATEAGMSLTQLALRWLLRRDEITSVLIGARTVEQLEQCASASGQEALPDDVLAAIDAVQA
ncbi:MAG: aldo/keto reductase [Akkermansia sp.]|nr:aldo/keto reductase [Akkermansia sp.]